MLCREQVARLLPHEAALQELGATLVFVSTGGSHWARGFAEERGITGPVLMDKDRTAYEALSLKRSFASTFSMGAVKAGRRAMAAGFRQGRTQGDPWQQGGAMIVLPGGDRVWSFASKSAGHHPDLSQMLSALRLSDNGLDPEQSIPGSGGA